MTSAADVGASSIFAEASDELGSINSWEDRQLVDALAVGGDPLGRRHQQVALSTRRPHMVHMPSLEGSLVRISSAAPPKRQISGPGRAADLHFGCVLCHVP